MPENGPETVVPERVYAVVVGVESYDYSSRWDLPGAARDALRFAAWLTGPCKVPVDNVLLLLSPLERSDLLTGLAVPDGLYEPDRTATRNNVEAALFTDIPGYDGDLLWFFWAGHGFIDTKNQLLLPYSDASTSQAVHLNLDSALRKLRSSHLPKGRFSRQIVIGDACRVMDKSKSGIPFDNVDYHSSQPVVDRGQFVLYACRPGEAAQNLSERGAGQFTDLLLAQLETRTLWQSVDELVDIARGVKTDLQRLKGEGKAWQEPQFHIDRDWDGTTLFGEAWTSGPGGRAMRLDQDAWDQLRRLLQDRTLPPATYDAYQWAFDVAECVAPTRIHLPADDLVELVRDLDSRQGGRMMPLTLPFVRYVAARTEDRDWGAELDAWVADTHRRLGTAAVPPAPNPVREPPTLHIQLTEASRKDTYMLRIWLHRDHFEFIWASTEAVSLAMAKTHLGDQLRSIYSTGTAVGNRATGLKRLEFHVPFHLLDESFDRWAVPIGRENRPPQELGGQFEVVVRCPDERTGTAHDHWVRKWQWFTAHGGAHPEAVHSLDDRNPDEVSCKDLHVKDTPVCVLADVGARHLDAVLNDILDGGIPIAVWHHGGRSETGPEPKEHIAAMLFTNPDKVDIRELPATVHQQRATLGQHCSLVLLWDNPELVPDHRSLAWQGQQHTQQTVLSGMRTQ